MISTELVETVKEVISFENERVHSIAFDLSHDGGSEYYSGPLYINGQSEQERFEAEGWTYE